MAVLGQSQYVIGPMTLSRTESFGSGYYNYLDQSNNNSSSNYYYTNLNGNSTMIEKRQVFLRSYQFCRKKSLSERIKRSLVRVKRVIWLRLKSARRFRKLACFRFRCGFSYRRRRFVRLLNNNNNNHIKCNNSNSHCFW
ncbi:hypothetical protein CsatB_030348 [Cannabis sativa]|uniref:uncharacterized protein LOC115721302 n=1 Tax=Cannabis sativa TaxID=3483 RepID=UPI0011DF3076|nr:uncharacterized protein LOC115721302 [Cannabis sativa]